jgi:hypothetical protein
VNQFPLLTINAEQSFFKTVISFVENSCLALGFGQEESLALTLATEEIFFYLTKNNHGCTVSIGCNSKTYYMDISLTFDAESFNPRAFNLTSNIDIGDEASLDELGLLIAGRSVDHFTMEENGSEIVISLHKYREYPKSSLPEKYPNSIEKWEISTPELQEVKIFVDFLHKPAHDGKLPFFFKYPGMVADMLKEGNINALLLKGRDGVIAGGLLWQKLSPGTIEFFGPYLFGQNDSEIKGYDLVDKFLEKVGKSDCRGLMCRYPSEFLPEKYFEIIGKFGENNIYFRQLREDLGTTSWIHPAIKEYLSQEYSRLFLPRNINLVKKEGELIRKYSVISSELKPSVGSVVLHPLIFGTDFCDNIKKHLILFETEKYVNIFFQLDLGNSHHSYFVPELLDNGFKPIFILPYGGKGDILFLQRVNSNSKEV